ncbi:uncharacterized, partial [Tachysurus ichikawai]
TYLPIPYHLTYLPIPYHLTYLRIPYPLTYLPIPYPLTYLPIPLPSHQSAHPPTISPTCPSSTSFLRLNYFFLSRARVKIPPYCCSDN